MNTAFLALLSVAQRPSRGSCSSVSNRFGLHESHLPHADKKGRAVGRKRNAVHVPSHGNLVQRHQLAEARMHAPEADEAVVRACQRDAVMSKVQVGPDATRSEYLYATSAWIQCPAPCASCTEHTDFLRPMSHSDRVLQP